MSSEVVGEIVAKVPIVMDAASWVTAIATAVLVLVTLWYAYLTRRILMTQSRPLVLIETAYIKNDDKGDRPRICLKNHGSGPAIEVNLTIAVEVSPISITDSSSLSLSVVSPMPIGQGQEICLDVVPGGEWYLKEYENHTPVFPVISNSLDKHLILDDKRITVSLSYKTIDGLTYEAFYHREGYHITRVRS